MTTDVSFLACQQFGHIDVITYDRSWRRLFRKQHYWRCWTCNLKEPIPWP